ncbi:MAG: PIN domain-containing protein [candidate division WWE3 bacterium]|nr:PIN domain-containing protein [candidate division WWE3 bacterium]
MLKLFVDSSVFYAIRDPKDHDHKKAIAIAKRLSGVDSISFVSTEVISESISLVSRRLGRKESIKLLEELRSGEFTVINPDWELLAKSDDIFRMIRSKNVSYCDCVSFAVMNQQDIIWAFSFDAHFKKHGFKRLGIDGWPK